MIPGAAETIPGVFLDKGGWAHSVVHPDYDAAGDGVTDDTAALQAAIDAVAAAGGGIVQFPQGIYGISSDLNLKAGVRLVGPSVGSRRVAAGTTSDTGAVIKWIGGGAPTDAVVVCNLTGTSQIAGVGIEGLRIDANGQAVGFKGLGIGPGAKFDMVVEQFSGKGVELGRAGGAYNTESSDFNLLLVPMATARGLSLSYCYSNRFNIKMVLAVGEVAAAARGIDLVEHCIGNTFFKSDIEDADLPIDIGTGAGGTCRANNFLGVRISNPTINPTAVTVGAVTATIGVAVRTNAAANTGNNFIGLRDEEGFTRLYYIQDTGDWAAGGVGTQYAMVLGGSTNFGAMQLGGKLTFNADNTHDIGEAAALRPRDAHLGRDLAVGRNASVVGTFTVGGASTLASLQFSNSAVIAQNTLDGADNRQISLASGGTASDTRGAYINLRGNEVGALPGLVEIASGSVAGARVQVTEGGSERFRVVGGVFALGTTVVTSAAAGEEVLGNAKLRRSVNAAGTDTIGLNYLNAVNQHVLNVNSQLLYYLNPLTQTTVGAAGGASALPATPTGYLRIALNGVERVMPYYAP